MTDDADLTPAEETLTRKGFIGASAATAAGAGLVGGPAGALANGASESPSERELRRRRLRVVREHAMSENVQRFDETLETFDEPRYEIIATGDVHDGTEEVSDYFVTGRAAFPDQRNSDYRFHYSAGDAKNRPVVILEFKLRGTHLGPLSGIPPTGKSFEARFCAFFFFERGGDKIVVERVYGDVGTILQQLGIFPRLYEGWSGPLKKW